MNKSLGSIVTVTWLSWIWSFDFFKKVCGGRERSNCNFLRSLRSYFVVKSLHFLKESKYFSLSFLYYETKKITEKIEKVYPWNWGVSIRHSAMEQFTGLLFEYVKLVCKLHILLESKWRHCSVTMAFIFNHLEF